MTGKISRRQESKDINTETQAMFHPGSEAPPLPKFLLWFQMRGHCSLSFLREAIYLTSGPLPDSDQERSYVKATPLASRLHKRAAPSAFPRCLVLVFKVLSWSFAAACSKVAYRALDSQQLENTGKEGRLLALYNGL